MEPQSARDGPVTSGCLTIMQAPLPLRPFCPGRTASETDANYVGGSRNGWLRNEKLSRSEKVLLYLVLSNFCVLFCVIYKGVDDTNKLDVHCLTPMSMQQLTHTQAAFHVGPGWAPVGQSWAPNGPRMGPTGAHLGMLLGYVQFALQYLVTGFVFIAPGMHGPQHNKGELHIQRKATKISFFHK